MRKYVVYLGAMLLPFSIFTTQAKEEHRQMDAHVHGQGTLNIAIDGNLVAMELEIPGMDLVGFEHRASTEEQMKLVEDAKKTLQDEGQRLFVLPPDAQCALESSHVKLSHDEHEAEEHEAEEHDGDEHEEQETHNEFHATYHFDCRASAKLGRIDFQFFKRFAHAEELDVIILDETGQQSYEVSREAPLLER